MIIPRRVLQARAPIMAFPTFTDPLPLELPIGTAKVTFFVDYTEGAPGGRPIFRIEFGSALPDESPAIDVARDIVIDEAAGLSVVSPNGTFDFYMRQPRGPDPVGATIAYVLAIRDMPGLVRATRLIAAEVGVPATPGLMQITATAWGP